MTITLLINLQNCIYVIVIVISYVKINTGHNKLTPRNKVVIDLSDTVSNGKNDDISFNQEPEHAPNNKKNISPTHTEKQYFGYKRKGIHEKSSLFNTKLASKKNQQMISNQMSLK